MKLTLRELFLMVALAAMGCAWWVDRSHVAAEFDDLRDRYKKLDARYDEVIAGRNRSDSDSFGFSSGFSTLTSPMAPTFTQPNDGR